MMKITKFKSTAILLVLCTLFIPFSLFAQSANNGSSVWIWALNNIFLVLAILVTLGFLGTIMKLIFDFIELQKLRLMKELGVEKEIVVEEMKAPLWKRIYEGAWNIVPIGEEKNIDLGHDYDGIRELDNKLPPWWLALMYGSIVFAAVYLYYYHWSSNDWSSIQEYEIAMEEAQVEKENYLLKQADGVNENTVTAKLDEASLLAGKDIYMTLCLPCHGAEGQGVVGPNLTDDYWIHGGSMPDIFKIIKYGAPEKGMISWNSQLKPSSMQNVASYIFSLKGTNPPNPKAQEGELYVPSEVTENPTNSEEQKDNIN